MKLLNFEGSDIMAEFYRFFDSTLDDPRKYDAEEFAEYFRQILIDGIFNGGTNLQVTCDGTNMNVKVNEGYGWIKGYLYKADNLGVDLQLDTADVVHDRIDRIILRWDKVNRYIKAFVLKGIPASIPVPSELTRNDSLYEISLAQVRVIAGKSFIASPEITDERLNTNVCGLVNSLVQVDTTTMQQEFDNFMAGLQSESYVTQSEFGTQVTDINNKIGDISGLVTTDKSSTVNGVNEVKLQANDLDSQMADLAKYPLATILGTEIQVTTQSIIEDGDRVLFEITLNISGGDITIKANGSTAYNLKDIEDINVTDLEKGYIEVIYRHNGGSPFFVLRPRSSDQWGGLKFIINEEITSLYHCDRLLDQLYELEIDTLLPINTFNSPGTNPTGIGGISDRLYHCDNSSNKLYELDIDTLLPINTVNNINTNPSGIGGISNRLYHCDITSDKLYELDLSTLLAINTVNSPGTTPRGIGGINNRLYHCDLILNQLYEIEINTLLPINTVNNPNTNPTGIGGISNRLYHCDENSTKLYELDINTLLPINTVDSPSTHPFGIGGIKSQRSHIKITKVEFEGIQYELTDDSPFRTVGVSVL